MSSKYTMVEPVATEGALGTVGGYSTSDSARLSSIFAGSPINGKEPSMDDDSIKKYYEENVLNGVIKGGDFANFNTDYSGAPNMEDVKTGAGGLPASAYVPNPVSPGEGSVNASDQEAAPAGFGTNPTSDWGSGIGSQLSPSVSSTAISGQKLGDYVKGES